jgi:hypothetical protein
LAPGFDGTVTEWPFKNKGLLGNDDVDKKSRGKLDKKRSTKISTKRSIGFQDYLRLLESDNFDFEKKMMYISEKIEAFEEKYPYRDFNFEQIFEDHIYQEPTADTLPFH